MLGKYDNLYGDTAVLTSLIRWTALRRLEREPPDLKSRLIHGSDYPFPPSRLPYLRRIGLFPPQRRNPLALDHAIKRSFDLGPRYDSLLGELLALPPTAGK